MSCDQFYASWKEIFKCYFFQTEQWPNKNFYSGHIFQHHSSFALLQVNHVHLTTPWIIMDLYFKAQPWTPHNPNECWILKPYWWLYCTWYWHHSSFALFRPPCPSIQNMFQGRKPCLELIRPSNGAHLALYCMLISIYWIMIGCHFAIFEQTFPLQFS